MGDNQNRANQELLRKDSAWVGVPNVGGGQQGCWEPVFTVMAAQPGSGLVSLNGTQEDGH